MEPNRHRLASLVCFARCVVRTMAFAAVFTLTMEVGARIDDVARYGAPFLGEYSDKRLSARHRLGFKYNLPNARFQKWQNNSLGFRGPEFRRPKPAGVMRIVCLGSSETYGLYESPGKEWPAQLNELLPKSRYQVVNGSVVGVSLKGFKSYLKNRILPLQPDLVVLVVNPLFYVASQSKAAKKEVASAAPAVTADKSLTEWLLVNSRLFPKVKQVVKQAVSTNFPDACKDYQLALALRDAREIEEQARLQGVNGMDAVPVNYLASYKKDLQETVELIRSHGAEVVLTSYPSLISRENIARHPEILLDNRRLCIYLSLNGIVNAFDSFNSVTAEVSRESEVPFVDVHRLVPQSLEYFADTVHYTDSGAHLFAASISRVLQSPGIARYSWRKSP